MTEANNILYGSELSVDRFNKKALGLSYFTVIYNIVEGILSIGAGIIASSIALSGFGIDSFIESLSGGVMIWRFSIAGKLTGKQIEEGDNAHAQLQNSSLLTVSFSSQ